MFASKLYADILQEVSLARKALKMDLTSKSSTSVRMYYTGASSNAYKWGSIQIIENFKNKNKLDKHVFKNWTNFVVSNRWVTLH